MKAYLLSLIPVGRQVLTGNGFGVAWLQSDRTASVRNAAGSPGDEVMPTVKIPERHS
jgi:hypothetical protein